ncbi:MAG: YncE family protein [Desulfuromonadaceae bacterium]
MRPCIGFLVALFFLSVILGGCSTGAPTRSSALRVTSGHTLVSTYFSSHGVSAENVSFVLDEVALLLGDLWIDLPAEPVVIDRQQVQGRQLLLGMGSFPTGECRRLRFKLSRIQVGQRPVGELPDQQIDLPLSQPITFSGGASLCLFVDWQLTAQMAGDARFTPLFSARGQDMPLAGDLAYVLCDTDDTLYMVRTDQNIVTASIGFTGPLGEIAVDSVRRRLYVVATGDRVIHVVNSDNARALDRIALPIAVSPRHLALSEDGVFAYVTDAATNQVLQVDLLSGLIARQATVGLRPERVIYFNDGDPHIAISSPIAQRVFVLRGDTLELEREIPAGLEADGLLYYADRLFVSERGSQSVTVFDFYTGRQLARISVGFEPSDLIESDGRIFVSNAGDGSLSVFYAGQNTTARRIQVGVGPGDLAVSSRRRMLYVADRENLSLSVLDLSGERIKAEVPRVVGDLAVLR